MGEEGTNFRLAQLEKENAEFKGVITKQAGNISDMEKHIIIIQQDTKSILSTYNIMKYLFLAFIITNLGMYLLKK